MSSSPFENPKVESYRDLVVWQKGVALTKATYVLTTEFPSSEKFGLVTQMRRAAVSVPSNIAEGQARRTTGEFIQSLSHAEGSLAELDTQLHLAVELGFTTPEKTANCAKLVNELRKMLNSLRRRLAERR